LGTGTTLRIGPPVRQSGATLERAAFGLLAGGARDVPMADRRGGETRTSPPLLLLLPIIGVFRFVGTVQKKSKKLVTVAPPIPSGAPAVEGGAILKGAVAAPGPQLRPL